MFAQHGVTVEARRDHLVDGTGRRFSLWNLASVCAMLDEQQWPDTITHHVGVLLSPAPSLSDLDDEQLAAALVLRLLPRDGLAPDAHPGAEQIAPGLVVVPAVQTEHEILTPSERDLALRGDLALLRARAQRNLEALAGSAEVHHQEVVVDRPEHAVHVMVGESPFVASLSLALETVLGRFGHADSGYGVLVATPYRHQLGYRVVDGPDSIGAVGHLADLAAHGFSAAPGPLSPHVHWVHEGQWHPVAPDALPEPLVRAIAP
ncbi:hypothetical protein ISG29_17870 [Nocardioides sp. CBS4Y-1]|uniref:Uncharacterized protein n=1 Tax=Nocardioides acrostichi TaxID=2784339 RepID=A0A930YEK0_9ACTN|nr:hypothetical protein [Nocardioides acrostichi]